MLQQISRILLGSSNSKIRIAAIGAACAAPLAFGITPAIASAIGYAYWGVHVWKDIPIPAGQLTGGVFGDGLYVNDAGGNFLSAGNICNWHVDIDLIDQHGKTFHRVVGTTVKNCTHAGQQKWLVKKTFPGDGGRACVRLYTAFNDNVASVCHHVHR